VIVRVVVWWADGANAVEMATKAARRRMLSFAIVVWLYQKLMKSENNG